LRLGPEEVSPELFGALRDGAVVAAPPVGVLDLLGPGAVACFQGLLTNDLEKEGDGAFVYGAVLTPKGMIVADGWAARQGARVTFTVPAAGRERTAAIYRRSIPPRLARWRDRTPECAVLRHAGPQAQRMCERAGIPVPAAPGRTIEALAHGTACDVALAPPGAPFSVQITIVGTDPDPLVDRLVDAGARAGGPAVLELARMLAGWPGLATEVDEKTIPQEVRYDEIGGVSYTKGCYTGQETVSRLHFRGHANRQLRGLLFDAEPIETPAVALGDRDIGRVTGMAWIPTGTHPTAAGRWVGLAVLRREVEPGATVRAANVAARVVDLPFALTYLEPA
jgi:folate-binding protein YgfZ